MTQLAIEVRSDRPIRPATSRGFVAWLPLAALPAAVLIGRSHLAPWLLMWSLSVAVYSALKWLTWWNARRVVASPSARRSLAYLLLWPGMDAAGFLDRRRSALRPTRFEVISGLTAGAAGLVLFWGVARLVPASDPILRGWIGLSGLIFMLHFGAFHLLSIGWRLAGVDAPPLMRAPIAAATLGEFWSVRWNTAFHVLARDYLVQPLRRRIGTPASVLAAFIASGLVHDLVISVPAGGGYGLPTAYFSLQGLALLLSRSAPGRRLGLSSGLSARLFAILVTAAPAYWLFHPAFVRIVVVPFMRALGAL